MAAREGFSDYNSDDSEGLGGESSSDEDEVAEPTDTQETQLKASKKPSKSKETLVTWSKEITMPDTHRFRGPAT